MAWYGAEKFVYKIHQSTQSYFVERRRNTNLEQQLQTRIINATHFDLQFSNQPTVFKVYILTNVIEI